MAFVENTIAPEKYYYDAQRSLTTYGYPIRYPFALE